jgi:hypothetical protein
MPSSRRPSICLCFGLSMGMAQDMMAGVCFPDKGRGRWCREPGPNYYWAQYSGKLVRRETEKPARLHPGSEPTRDLDWARPPSSVTVRVTLAGLTRTEAQRRQNLNWEWARNQAMAWLRPWRDSGHGMAQAIA